MATAQDVKMKMKHALAAIDACIDDEAIPGIGNSFQICNLVAGQHQAPDQRNIRILQLGYRREMCSGDNEGMYRRLGIDIVERHHQLVFIDERCWNSPRNDFAKKTVAHLVASFLKPDFPKRVANS